MKRPSDKQLREVELRGLRRLTAGQVHHRAPVWAPGGRWLCVEVGDGDESCWLVCDGKGRVGRVLDGPAAGGAAFAPDGGLAFGRRVGATIEIWYLDSGGSAPRQLLGGDGRLYRDPAYSPDGRWLCYAADDGGDDAVTRLWRWDLQSGEHRPVLGIPTGVGLLARPAWSPDGACVYFEAASNDGVAIYAIGFREAGGEGTLRQVSAPTSRCRRPASLGGGLLIVERELEDGASELVLLDIGQDGDDPRERRRKAGRETAAGRSERKDTGGSAGAYATDDRRDDRAAQPVSGLVLTDRERCARQPALCLRKGEVHLAFAMLGRAPEGEPRRYDIYVCRVAGLARRRGEREAAGR